MPKVEGETVVRNSRNSKVRDVLEDAQGERNGKVVYFKLLYISVAYFCLDLNKNAVCTQNKLDAFNIEFSIC